MSGSRAGTAAMDSLEAEPDAAPLKVSRRAGIRKTPREHSEDAENVARNDSAAHDAEVRTKDASLQGKSSAVSPRAGGTVNAIQESLLCCKAASAILGGKGVLHAKTLQALTLDDDDDLEARVASDEVIEQYLQTAPSAQTQSMRLVRDRPCPGAEDVLETLYRFTGTRYQKLLPVTVIFIGASCAMLVYLPSDHPKSRKAILFEPRSLSAGRHGVTRFSSVRALSAHIGQRLARADTNGVESSLAMAYILKKRSAPVVEAARPSVPIPEDEKSPEQTSLSSERARLREEELADSSLATTVLAARKAREDRIAARLRRAQAAERRAAAEAKVPSAREDESLRNSSRAHHEEKADQAPSGNQSDIGDEDGSEEDWPEEKARNGDCKAGGHSVDEEKRNRDSLGAERDRELELERRRQLELEQQRRDEQERQRAKEVELESRRQEELARHRQEELERQRVEELERQRQDELERQRREDLERQRQEELEAEQRRREELEVERKRQEEIERRRQEDLERQRREKAEQQRQKELERQRREELERERQEELAQEQKRQEELERARKRKEDLERKQQEELERKQQEELERQRQEDLERRRQEELERERQRQEELELEKQRQEELEREKQRQEELEREKQRLAELERERQRQEELERERQRQAELERERQRQMELERERQRQEELERERQRQAELERERQRQMELELEREQEGELELERQRQEELEANEREKHRLEAESKAAESRRRAERAERERQEQEQEQSWRRQLALEKERNAALRSDRQTKYAQELHKSYTQEGATENDAEAYDADEEKQHPTNPVLSPVSAQSECEVAQADSGGVAGASAASIESRATSRLMHGDGVWVDLDRNVSPVSPSRHAGAAPSHHAPRGRQVRLRQPVQASQSEPLLQPREAPAWSVQSARGARSSRHDHDRGTLSSRSAPSIGAQERERVLQRLRAEKAAIMHERVVEARIAEERRRLLAKSLQADTDLGASAGGPGYGGANSGGEGEKDFGTEVPADIETWSDLSEGSTSVIAPESSRAGSPFTMLSGGASSALEDPAEFDISEAVVGASPARPSALASNGGAKGPVAGWQPQNVLAEVELAQGNTVEEVPEDEMNDEVKGSVDSRIAHQADAGVADDDGVAATVPRGEDSDEEVSPRTQEKLFSIEIPVDDNNAQERLRRQRKFEELRRRKLAENEQRLRQRASNQAQGLDSARSGGHEIPLHSAQSELAHVDPPRRAQYDDIFVESPQWSGQEPSARGLAWPAGGAPESVRSRASVDSMRRPAQSSIGGASESFRGRPGGADSARTAPRGPMSSRISKGSLATPAQGVCEAPPEIPPTIEIATKSNLKLIMNAITHVCLAGVHHAQRRDKVLSGLEERASSGSPEFRNAQYVILFRNEVALKFRGIYVVDRATRALRKIQGAKQLPVAVDAGMIDSYYKYNTGQKRFSRISTKSVTKTTDAVALNPKFFPHAQRS